MRHHTVARLEALQLADTFVALPRTINRMDLLDALEIGRHSFNLSDAELLYLRLAFRNVPAEYWQKGKEPIFSWARLDIARALGKHERSVCRIEQGLVAKGFIVHRDAPRYQRYKARPHAKGAGVSLAPVGARAAEILAARQDALRDHRAWYRARKDLYRARNACLGLVRTAAVDGETRAAIHEKVSGLPSRVSATMALEELQALLAEAARIEVELSTYQCATQMSLWGDETGPPDYTPDTPYPETPPLERSSLADPSLAPGLTAAVAEKGVLAAIPEAVLLSLVRRHGPITVHTGLDALHRALMKGAEVKSTTAYLKGILVRLDAPPGAAPPRYCRVATG